MYRTSGMPNRKVTLNVQRNELGLAAVARL